MSDLVSANVAYSFKIEDKKFLGPAGYLAYGTLTLGDGALTLPAGGIPIDKGKMGLPTLIKSLKVVEAVFAASPTVPMPYAFSYDVSAEKILVSYAPGFTPAGTVSAPVINAASNSGNVAADFVLGIDANRANIVCNAAVSNIAGIQAPTFTGTAVAASSILVDAVGTAPASMILTLEVRGY